MIKLRIYILLISLIAFNFVYADNALWNKDKNIKAFWVYEQTGSCKILRKSKSPLVFSLEGNKSKYEVSELDYCFSMEANKKGINSCQTGIINISYSQTTNTFTGSYNLLMANGKKITGDFKANYCAEDSWFSTIVDFFNL